MFVYLSKKIAIPNGIPLQCIAWNKEHGYIACGGDDGLLKVLKLEMQVKTGSNIKGLAAPTTLSMNQTLEGHQKSVRVTTWNDSYQKLTSSDQNGLIIVWVLHKETWYEEMINSRNKSVVRSMSWSSDGQKICIAYEDGAVIVGSVDGNRIWGKDFKGLQLCKVVWSPDGKLILFGTVSGEIKIFDNLGNILGKVEPLCLVNVTGAVSIVGMHWYDGRLGYPMPNCPCLAICYDNGRCQVMRNEHDEHPILIDTKMQAVDCRWNDNGSVLAVIGSQRSLQQDKDINVTQFFTPVGEPLFTLKLPGNTITSLDWEGKGLRLAIGIDSFIYFANIRPDYKWGYCGNAVVYAYNKVERDDFTIAFWSPDTNTKHVKHVKGLIQIASSGEHCCLLTRYEENPESFVLVLCNAIGTPLDSKLIDFEPHVINMSDHYVVAANKNAFYAWQYTTPRSLTSMDFAQIIPSQRIDTQERLIHIDNEHPEANRNEDINFNVVYQSTQDNICSICVSDKIIVVARESGTFHRYAWPHLELTNRYAVTFEPKHISLNCTSSRLAMISTSGILTFFDLNTRLTDENGVEVVGEHLMFERKDVWDMRWSNDNAELFAMMEKTRMYIFRNLDPEEPIQCSGFICKFNDLEVTSVLLDEIMKDPDNPKHEDLLQLEVKSLRDTRALVKSVGLKDAAQFVDDNPHPRLWRLLAEAALEKLDLSIAEHAFVRCKDYQGIELVKRVGQLQSPKMKQAEIAAYFRRFEEAEGIYMSIDRNDLAVELRMKLGDWFRVVQLLKMNTGAVNDKLLTQAWNAIGEYYAERQKWQNAATYFQKSNNIEKLIECYYMMEEFDKMAEICEELPENHPLLMSLAKTFRMVGMCQQAVTTYLKANQVKAAIDTCVYLNQWDQAVTLAKEHNVKETNSLLAKYASHLMEKGSVLQAIELYRKANDFIQAAKLLLKVAEDEEKRGASALQMKKVYVLAGVLVEQHKAKRKAKSKTGLSGFLEEDEAGLDSQVLNRAWKGAEAYHFYLMAQRQLYEGYVDAAMRTAIVLKSYDNIINPIKIYSLLALASASNRAFNLCSQAFIKLETSLALNEDQKKSYKDLAIQIFTRHSPKDQRQSLYDAIDDSMICVASGQPITPDYQYWECSSCHHSALDSEMRGKDYCPLCHASVNSVMSR